MKDKKSTHPASFACSLPVAERPCSGLIPFFKVETIRPASLGLERPWRRSLLFFLERKKERGEVEVVASRCKKEPRKLDLFLGLGCSVHLFSVHFFSGSTRIRLTNSCF